MSCETHTLAGFHPGTSAERLRVDAFALGAIRNTNVGEVRADVTQSRAAALHVDAIGQPHFHQHIGGHANADLARLADRSGNGSGNP